MVSLLAGDKKLEFQVGSGELVGGCIPKWEDLVCVCVCLHIGAPSSVFQLQEELELVSFSWLLLLDQIGSVVLRPNNNRYIDVSVT